MKDGRKSRPGNPKVSRKKPASPLFKKLEAGLKEAIELKKSGNYLDRDFDSLVDAL
jgi:hypothetical protein